MQIHEFDESGKFIKSHEMADSQELPEHFERMTEVAPPEVGEGYLTRWNGGEWVIEIARPLISY